MNNYFMKGNRYFLYLAHDLQHLSALGGLNGTSGSIFSSKKLARVGGGIDRHGRLRGCWEQAYAGSSPVPRTT